MQPPQPQPEPASRRASSTCSTAPRRRSSGGIGCMAGLLRLISPYHRSHHRKRLTAKNNAAARDSPQALPITPSSSPPRKKAAAQAHQTSAASPATASPVKPMKQQLLTTTAVTVRRRRSCDAPRSPTIAPEHRRSSCDSPRPPPPAIIARLMGLEESAPPSPAAAAAAPRPVVLPTRPPPPPPAPAAPETAAEKRRKLLGALEKCDEDLKTLRRIIAAVRAAEMRAASASDVCPVAATTTTTPAGKGAKSTFGRDDEQSPSPSPPTPQQQHKVVRAGEQQYPSPDSVLDAISSPRFPCRKRPSPCTDLDVGGKGGCGNGALAPTVGSKIVKPSRTLVFSGGYCKTKSDGDELPLHAVHYPVPLVVGMPPRSAGAESWRHHRRRWEQEAAAAGRVISRATAESVGEAIMWVRQQQGQLGGAGDDERGRVAAALERAIVHDLVADLVAELLQAQSGGHGAGSGCRKRLCF
ncbi:nascent polypeptide-associated complex subunit alpha, muscle-specific form [Sorghum bicolor]|nr:nascent polypeptide-associated complex subunit alpha, muscle-specific form [Sorghum bicolor]|eukprot:XP_002467949.2 nascent polypeptide-associated complex subunit alpha, muscle-specific form [Sorghum bicolor]